MRIAAGFGVLTNNIWPLMSGGSCIPLLTSEDMCNDHKELFINQKKWCELHTENSISSSHKRPMASETDAESQKRRATVTNVNVDIQKVREMLEASLSNDYSEVYNTASRHSQESVKRRDDLHTADTPVFPLTSTSTRSPYLKNCPHSMTSPSLFSMASTVSDDEASRHQSCASTPWPLSRAASLKLTTHALPDVTVLFIDIKGFTSACAAMTAARVGEWVADFYERVDAVAAAHGVSKIEVRGDCCVCVAGVAGRIPYRAIAHAADDPLGDQATRMLAFAAALHADLATLPSSGPAAATTTRMGIASGEVAFLVSDAAAGPDIVHFASVRGDAVDTAGWMEALAAAGEALVHMSAADRWAAEGRRAPPATVCMEVKGGGLQRAAVFDCTEQAFRPTAGCDPAAAAEAGRFTGRPLVAPLQRSASCHF